MASYKKGDFYPAGNNATANGPVAWGTPVKLGDFNTQSNKYSVYFYHIGKNKQCLNHPLGNFNTV